MKIGVKYCGNCNPHVQMSSVLHVLADRLPSVEFVHWEKPGIGLLLVLCGCPNGCAPIPDFDGRTIFVTSQAVDHWPAAEDELVEKLMHAIEDH